MYEEWEFSTDWFILFLKHIHLYLGLIVKQYSAYENYFAVFCSYCGAFFNFYVYNYHMYGIFKQILGSIALLTWVFKDFTVQLFTVQLLDSIENWVAGSEFRPFNRSVILMSQMLLFQIHIDIPRMSPLIPLFQQKVVQEVSLVYISPDPFSSH